MTALFWRAVFKLTQCWRAPNKLFWGRDYVLWTPSKPLFIPLIEKFWWPFEVERFGAPLYSGNQGSYFFWGFFKKSRFPRRHRFWWCDCLYLKWSWLMGLKAHVVHLGTASTDCWKINWEVQFPQKNPHFAWGLKLRIQRISGVFFKTSWFPRRHRLWWCDCLYLKWSWLMGLKAHGVHLGTASTDFWKIDLEVQFSTKNPQYLPVNSTP